MGWTVGSALSFAQGHAIIAMGKCPVCEKNWSKAHRKCCPGLFPGEKGE